MNWKFTDAEIKKLLQGMVILVDSREQENSHILTYFDNKKILHQTQKLDCGDYSAMIPANAELGISRDIYFTDSILIERKGSLEELSGNLTQERTRFENELLRAGKTKFYLMIEDASGFANIIHHRYRTQYEPKSFVASLMTYQARYGVHMQFIPVDISGIFVHQILFYHCRECLKGGLQYEQFGRITNN